MRVTIIIDDTERGIFPVIKWEDNGCTDHLATSLGMNLAAQFANMVREYSKKGILKVVGTQDFQ